VCYYSAGIPSPAPAEYPPASPPVPPPVQGPRGIIPSTFCPPPLSKIQGRRSQTKLFIIPLAPCPIPPISWSGVAKLFRGYSAVEFQGSSSLTPLAYNPSSPLFPLASDPAPARPPNRIAGLLNYSVAIPRRNPREVLHLSLSRPTPPPPLAQLNSRYYEIVIAVHKIINLYMKS